MIFIQNLFIVWILFASAKLEASPFQPSMMKGNFKSCLEGICHLVSEIYFIENECFNKSRELGVYYYLNKILHIAQLTGEYEIIRTNCTMSADDEIKIDKLGLLNFFNDQYDIVYLIILAAAKITIGVLCFLLCKNRRGSNKIISPKRTNEINWQPIRNNTSKHQRSLEPSAPPMPKNEEFIFDIQERTIPETRGSVLTSTCVSEIYPSFSKSYVNQTSCSCHATEKVCINCSCVRNKRACNVECHIPRNAKKPSRAFKCVNKYN